jgi:hypothetical protein
MKIKENPTLRTAVLTALSLGFAAIPAHAATVTWDGGAADGNLFATAANWDPDKTPTNGDTFIISTAVTVTGPAENLPNGANINLTGGAALTTNGAVIRLNNSNISVGSGSSLTGAFWDLDDADITFANGAVATMANWEQKDINVFNFQLGAAGFTTLTPGTFRIGTGSLTGSIANATYNVDMAAYTGGAGIITLMDFTTDAAAMDNTLFQTAGGLNVLNAGAYTANLQWNDTTEAIELNITGVPEPSSLAIFGLGALAIVYRRRRLAAR